MFDISDIVSNVRCDLQTGANIVPFIYEPSIKDPQKPGHVMPLGWTATITVTLEGQNKTTSNVNANLGIPLNPSTGTPTLDYTLTNTAENTAVVKFVEFVPRPPFAACETSAGSGLHGNLGITSWLRSVQSLIKQQHRLDDGSPTDREEIRPFVPQSIGTTIKFTIENDGKLGAKLEALPISFETLGAGGSHEFDHSTENTLEINLTQNDPPKPPAPPLRVVIVSGKAAVTAANPKTRSTTQENIEKSLRSFDSFSTSRKLDDLDQQLK